MDVRNAQQASSQPQQTVSIPSIVAFALVSFIAIRWFFFSPPSSSSTTSSSSTSSTNRQFGRSQRRQHNFPSSRVDQITSMFPQLSRRDVEWDLVQNGGSLQATTERVLVSGRLPAAPANFSALYASPTNTQDSASRTSGQQRGTSSATSKLPQHSDLITRYNLSSRVGQHLASSPDGDEHEVGRVEGGKVKEGWSSSKTERQVLLKRRRDDMILEARRRLEDRDRKGKGPAQ